jgi:hypothetical protein
MNILKNVVLGLSMEEKHGMCTAWLNQLKPVDLLRYVRGNSGKANEAAAKLLQRCSHLALLPWCFRDVDICLLPIQCSVAPRVWSQPHSGGEIQQYPRLFSRSRGE